MRWFLLLMLCAPATAAPVIPNFKQGTLSSHTETTRRSLKQSSAKTMPLGLNILPVARTLLLTVMSTLLLTPPLTDGLP